MSASQTFNEAKWRTGVPLGILVHQVVLVAPERPVDPVSPSC